MNTSEVIRGMVPSVTAVVVLTFVTTSMFRGADMPLDANSTVVAALIWTLVIASVRAVYRAHAARQVERNKPQPQPPSKRSRRSRA